MTVRIFFLCFTLLITNLLSGQHPLTKIDKTTHLGMLKNGVLLVRLSDQNKKVEALVKRGQSTAAENLSNELKSQNDQIIKAFQTHFKFARVYFIKPVDTKSILKNKSNPIVDLATGNNIELADVNDIYVTDYGYGHPAEGNERYNRKGFQILYIEDGEVRDIGRDLFYAGVKQGVLAPNFNKNLQKTVYKLNRRLESGNKYLK